MPLPPAFAEWSVSRLGDDHQEFVSSFEQSKVRALLHNPKKSLDVSDLEPVSWHDGGKYMPSDHAVGTDPFWHAGCYYSMDASCMFLAQAINYIQGQKPPTRVLDLCAAPGGKSLLLSQILEQDTLIVSNEISKKRVSILKENWIKWGSCNQIITSASPERFKSLSDYFDLILVDAPCSGEGMFRKKPKSQEQWTSDIVHFNAQRQKKILSQALKALRPGGFLIYCTCTYNDAENIDNVDWLTTKHQMRSIPLSMEESWNIEEITRHSAHGYQCWPHRLRGEGFFFALLQKPDEGLAPKSPKMPKPPLLHKKTRMRIRRFFELPEDIELTFSDKKVIVACPSAIVDELHYIRGLLNTSYLGTELGMMNKDLFVPLHALAMNHRIPTKRPKIEVSYQDAMKYLRRETLHLDYNKPGWAAISYEGVVLGWMKFSIRRHNNYYPINWRIKS